MMCVSKFMDIIQHLIKLFSQQFFKKIKITTALRYRAHSYMSEIQPILNLSHITNYITTANGQLPYQHVVLPP